MKRVVTWLSGVFALAAALFAVQCTPTAPPVAVGVTSSATVPGSTKPTGTVKPHPVTSDKEFIDNSAKQAKQKLTDAEKPLDKTLDPAVFGEYRMKLSDEQTKQIDEAIARIKQDVAAGKEGADAGLNIALAAKQLAEKLVVNLKPNGRYSADLGTGDSGGKYKTGKGVVLLTPDVVPKDPNEPRDVEMLFDKANHTLTVDFQGQKMLFVRKK